MSKINKSNFSNVIEASSKKQTLKEKKTMFRPEAERILKSVIIWAFIEILRLRMKIR